MRPPLGWFRSLLVVGTVGSPLACTEPLPQIRYVTDQAEIGTDFGHSICPSELAWLDGHIEYVEDLLDAGSDERIEIYLYQSVPPQCHLFGCYTEEGYIASNWNALDHEVVHAVVDRIGDPPPFWSEGIAEALTRRGTYRGYRQAVSENVMASDSTEVDYATAGHFVRWLIQTRGIESVRMVLEGGSVEHAFGQTLAQLEAEYEEDAPYAYPPIRDACDFLPLPAVDEVSWSEDIAISCDREGIFRFEGFWLSAVRTVQLPAGRYELRVSGGEGARIVGCQDREWSQPPPEMVNGDVPNAVEDGQTAWGVLFESERTHMLDLTEGRYKIVLPTWDDEDQVQIVLRRLGVRARG
ncbi:MAG: hypothetical protein AB1Z98_30565 [Nannocystaceae bacterium]